MADQIRKVEYFVVQVADKAGAGARVLRELASAGVNLLAFTGFPVGKKAQLDFIPRDTALFRKAMRKAGRAIKAKKIGFLVQGNDRKGAVASIMEKLAAAGINVTACDALAAGGGRWGAIFWVSPKEVGKAAKVLGIK